MLPTSSFLAKAAFKLKNPRKGTETQQTLTTEYVGFLTFKLKNPRKGTETLAEVGLIGAPHRVFQIKESPEGD